nr:receptor-like protein Cf-9 homolog [Ziziphus jujuba var. spinosa]
MSFLRKLSILDLSSLFQTPCLENSNLTMLLQNLILLEELYLDGVNLTIPGNEWGQALSSSLSNLRVLRMKSCSLSETVDESLCKLQSLSMIKLDSNNLSSSIPTLKILDISENDLLDGSFPEFPQDSNLQSLETRSTNFRGTIPASIGNLQQLSTLELSVCHYSGTLPKSMTNLTQLVFLHLFGKNFTGSIPSFHMSKNLTEIHLSFNRFTGPLPSAAYWQGLLNLVYVDLTNNTITGSVPSSLFSLPSMQWIDLSYNQFSGRLLEFQIPPSSVLASVDLRGNELEGPIPKSFFKLKNLGDLLLPFNRFNGTFQLDMIQNLINLEPLELSYNNLLSVNTSGNNSNFSSLTLFTTLKLASCNLRTFPDMLRNQPVLNNLSGPIPDAFPVNCSLENLDVDGNLLTGRISKSLVNCRALEVLNVGNNQILDTFPLMLKNTSTLRVLVLQSNKFYGHITCGESIVAWPKIQILNVASNNFSGEPSRQCLTRFYAMMAVQDDVLDIYEQMIHGTPKFAEILHGVIPPKYHYEDGLTINNKGLEMELVKIPKGFTFIDFSSNNFRGEIPNELGQLKFLHALNLSNNALNSHIPSSFGNLRQLESLDC